MEGAVVVVIVVVDDDDVDDVFVVVVVVVVTRVIRNISTFLKENFIVLIVIKSYILNG